MYSEQLSTTPKHSKPIGMRQLATTIFDTSGAVEKIRVDVVLDITDKIRAARHSRLPFGDVTEDLSELLELLVSLEDSNSRLGFSTICTSRLDKLLGELTNLRESDADEIEDLVRCANILRRKWQTRFGERYFVIDQIRLEQLSIKGALCLSSTDFQRNHEWLVNHPNPGSEKPGALHFQPGQWWPSLACAYRDGIVGTPSPDITTGAYGVTAFSLVQGVELEGKTPGEVIFLHHGALKDVGVPLLSEVGRSIRILRGYQLRSKYAPIVGLRYDGLYTLKLWGHRLNPATNIYSSKMVFQRNCNQRPMDEILSIPMPSQLDDWELYQKIAEKETRKQYGDEAYLQAKCAKRTKRKSWVDQYILEGKWSKELAG